ncbi:MAG: hypothetical protein ACR2OB_14800 [Solirubrobacteraceae bacterium]
MILPPGHGQSIGVKRRLRAREKWMLGGVLAVTALLVLTVVFSFAAGSHRSANGCVEVTIPYSTGGQDLFRCGAGARAMCRLTGTPRGYTGAPGRTVAAECRKAKLPVGA